MSWSLRSVAHVVHMSDEVVVDVVVLIVDNRDEVANYLNVR